jgi:Set1/Ash2 histone methyltransferase complex subunit ASH2
MNKKRKDKRGGGGSPDADENGGGKPPSFDSLNNKRGSKRKVYDSTYLNPNELSNFNPNSNNLNGSNNSNAFLSALKKKAGPNDLSRLEKMVPTRFPTDHPFNKDSYRYYLVEPDPHSPHRQKFEETELWAGKPLPGHLYRLFLEPRVVLSLHDRAPQLRVNDERLAVTGEKGYAMVRGTHGVSHGSWYYEVSVRGGEMPSGGAVRLGWAQKLANLQAPCGYDKFSYAWRSRKGTVFHDSKGRSYSRLRDSKSGGWGHDDVIGCLITLPVVDSSKQILPDCCKNMVWINFFLLFIIFFKNLFNIFPVFLRH